MTKREFLTVTEDLVEYAESAANGFQLRGYRISVEKRQLGQPYTPVLAARRRTTLVIVEVMNGLDVDRLEEWVRYCKSTGKDVRLALVIPSTAIVTPEAKAFLRERGIGLYISANTLVEEIAPRDLGLNVELPDRRAMSSRVRGLLGSIYDQFDRSNWQEGFGDACTVLEQQARRYLQEGMASGRIDFAKPDGTHIAISSKKIAKMPMGPLAEAFGLIARPNRTDSVIGEILAKLNRDRVGEAHYKGKAPTERRLRRNVGSHMWAIAEGLKLLCD